MTILFPTLAFLQGPANNLFGPIFMYAAIFAIFYFILIRPGQKQRKAQEEMVRQVKRGDEIVTAGGIVGEVIHIREVSTGDDKRVPGEDRITIKSGDSRLIIERGRITRVVKSAGAPAAEG